MAVVAISIFFSICLWQNLADLQGWPTIVQPPQKFEIKWVDVKEPNKKTGDPGGIYVWLKDINPEAAIDESYYLRFHHKELEEEPRIHKMPYSRPAHEQAQGIMARIAKGKRVFAQMGAQGSMGEMCDSDCDGEKCGGKCDGKGKPGQGQGRPGQGKPGQGKPGSQLASQGRGGSLSQEQDWIFHELPPPLFQEKLTPSTPPVDP
jgi:hypothetical protein